MQIFRRKRIILIDNKKFKRLIRNEFARNFKLLNANGIL